MRCLQKTKLSRAAALAAVLTAALAAPGTNSIGLPMKAPAVVSLQPAHFTTGLLANSPATGSS
jgi:hypothetical protein